MLVLQTTNILMSSKT